MKKIILFLTVLFLTLNVLSQENKKVKEIGLTLYNLDHYGMIFKIGKEDKLWRFRVLTGEFENSKDGYPAQRLIEKNSFDFNLAIGRERRKNLTSKLNFIYGIELTGGIIFNDNSTTVRGFTTSGTQKRIINSGFTGVLGLNYFFSKNIFMGVELLPSAIYSYESTLPYISTSYPVITQKVKIGFGENSFLLTAGIKF